MNPDKLEKWRLGVQAYTFRQFSFVKAVEKTAKLGLKWIEGYPQQVIFEDSQEQKLYHTLPSYTKDRIRACLKDSGVCLAAYGVVKLPENRSEIAKIFEFAKEMGADIVVSEPPEDLLDTVEDICRQYEMCLAIHNHPEPSSYWNPDEVVRVCSGRSERLGACCDIGHWLRSGIDPLDAVDKLAGRVISIHLKDVRDGRDVPLGKGEAQVASVLERLKEQGFSGLFSIEYEAEDEDLDDQVEKCAKYFREFASGR